MGNNVKRIVSLLLAGALVFSACPISARADDTQEEVGASQDLCADGEHPEKSGGENVQTVKAALPDTAETELPEKAPDVPHTGEESGQSGQETEFIVPEPPTEPETDLTAVSGLTCEVMTASPEGISVNGVSYPVDGVLTLKNGTTEAVILVRVAITGDPGAWYAIQPGDRAKWISGDGSGTIPDEGISYEYFTDVVTELQGEINFISHDVLADTPQGVIQSAYSVQILVEDVEDGEHNPSSQDEVGTAADWDGLTLCSEISINGVPGARGAFPGDEIEAVITLRNGTGSMLKDVVVSLSSLRNCSDYAEALRITPEEQFNSSALKWNVAEIPGGGENRLYITLKIKDEIPQGSSFNFDPDATVRSAVDAIGNQLPLPKYASEDIRVPIYPAVDYSQLTVSQRLDTVQPPRAGDEVTIQLNVNNGQGLDFKNIQIQNVLDSNLTFVRVSCYQNDCSYDPVAGMLTIPELSGTEPSHTIRLTARIREDTQTEQKIENTATVLEASGKIIPEEQRSSSHIAFTVNDKNFGRTMLRMASDKTEVACGDTVEYTVTVHNHTGGRLKIVSLQILTSANLSFLSASLDSGEALQSSTSGSYDGLTVYIPERWQSENVIVLRLRAEVESSAVSGQVTLTVRTQNSAAGLMLPIIDAGEIPPAHTDWSGLRLQSELHGVEGANVDTLVAGGRANYRITVINDTGRDLKDISVSLAEVRNQMDFNGINYGSIENSLTHQSAGSFPVEYDSETAVLVIPELKNGFQFMSGMSGRVCPTLQQTATVRCTVSITEAVSPLENQEEERLSDVPGRTIRNTCWEKVVSVPTISLLLMTHVYDASQGFTGVDFGSGEGGDCILAPSGATEVTALYKVIVSGTPGASYKISSEGGTCVRGDTEGILPETGKTEAYFTRVLAVAEKSITYINTASVELDGNVYTATSDVFVVKSASSLEEDDRADRPLSWDKSDPPISVICQAFPIEDPAAYGLLENGQYVEYAVQARCWDSFKTFTMTDQWSEHIEIIRTAVSEGSYENGVWTLGYTQLGHEVYLTLIGKVKDGTPEGTVLENSTSVTYAVGWDDSVMPEDCIIEGNTAYVLAKAQIVPPDLPKADWAGLTVTQASGPSSVRPGKTVQFSLKVTNKTGTDLEQIRVSLKLDPNLTLISTDGCYDETTGLWSVEKLRNGDSEILTIRAKVQNSLQHGTLLKNLYKIVNAQSVSGDAMPEGQPSQKKYSIKISNKRFTVPETGDRFPLYPLLAVMGISAAALIMLLLFHISVIKNRRRRGKHKRAEKIG